jgi:hypothetical protein
MLVSASDRLRQKRELFNRIKLILAVQSCLKKFSAFPVGQITFTNLPRPVPLEGRLAIVTNAGRDAVDARCRKTGGADPPSLKLRRDWYQDPRVAFVEAGADGEVVWS